MDNYTITLDYLAASVEADPKLFGDRLAEYLGGAVQLARPRNGYTFGYAVEVQDEVLAEFHVRAGDPVWCFATGSKSQDLWDFLTASPWEWEVTRHDAALDVYDAEWFPILVDFARKHAELHGLTTGVAGDWCNPVRGRTFYLGARSSRFFHRIYEKGRKERADANWIRIELEHKPQSKVDRINARHMTAAQVWAMHAGPIFGRALGLDLAAVFDLPCTKQPRVRRDQDRARRAFCAQYGKTFTTWLNECGGDPVALVAEIMATIEHQKSVHEWQQAPAVSLPELQVR